MRAKQAAGKVLKPSCTGSASSLLIRVRAQPMPKRPAKAPPARRNRPFILSLHNMVMFVAKIACVKRRSVQSMVRVCRMGFLG